MKISVNWINQLLNSSLTAEKMAEILTATGLEVEAISHVESIPGGLKGLVTGEVLTCGKHPGADRLSLTTVDVGNETPYQIVCGAPNVAAGQKVIVAVPGTTIHPLTGEPFTIKESKIRGEKSQGMICAEDEIGIGESHDGIMVLPPETKVGIPAAELFNIENDTVLEIGLTPNRADAVSHIGVARDLAAALNIRGEELRISFPESTDTKEATQPEIKVEIKSTDCIRYSGIYISGIEVKDSPDWVVSRLKNIGLRPVNNIVDITNLIMMESGQPLHAFDADKIKSKKLVIQHLSPSTTFTTLDGKERKLNGEELMITDGEKGLAMAGIYGGVDSGVSSSTKNIFLESACFNPVVVRKAGKHHGLKTDSSFRFERGTDPNMTLSVMHRAVKLISELAGGDLSNGHVDVYPEKLEPFKISFSPEKCNKLTGVEIEKETMQKIFTGLGICTVAKGDVWEVEVPRFKVDVTREVDLIEEILRIYGYDNIPLATNVSVPLSSGGTDKKAGLRRAISHMLTGLGFYEMMNNSLSSASLYQDEKSLVHILNPLSQELNVMRQDMMAVALQTVSYNKNRQLNDLHLFEFGKVYSVNENGKYREREILSIVTTGMRYKENWKENPQSDFFYLKGVVGSVLEKAGIQNLKEEEIEDNRFDWAVRVLSGQKEIGVIGKVSASMNKQHELEEDVYFTELQWGEIAKLSAGKKASFSELSKFPMVRRDLALLVDKNVNYSRLEDISRKAGGRLLKNIFLFDVYEGKNLPEGKVSYAIGYELQDTEKTLTDQQVEKVMVKVLKSMETETGATLR